MLGILCGLESEAKIARRIKGARVACAAARPGKARMLAQELIGQGATRLVSFGVAGGLAQEHPIGALVIGAHVKSATGTWHCDSAWNNTLAQKLPQAIHAGVWGSETLVPTAEDKRALYRLSGCVIVDMESQCVAEAAAAARIPFTVLRAVCDTANMNVPLVIMAAIGEDGSVDAWRALGHLARRPREIPDLFHVTRGISRALGALKASVTAF
jgi:hopanoid-associated phosphorylase